jgi:hypothetical protein
LSSNQGSIRILVQPGMRTFLNGKENNYFDDGKYRLIEPHKEGRVISYVTIAMTKFWLVERIKERFCWKTRNESPTSKA